MGHLGLSRPWERQALVAQRPVAATRRGGVRYGVRYRIQESVYLSEMGYLRNEVSGTELRYRIVRRMQESAYLSLCRPSAKRWTFPKSDWKGTRAYWIE